MDKVLIVDSDQIFLKKLNEGLQKYIGQFEVVTALNAEDALEVLNSETISVLVTGLVMAAKNGREILTYMRKKRPQVPCVMMTEPKNSEIKNEADRGGIFRYLEKPFDSNELAAVIIEGLDRLDEGLFWKEHRK